MRTCDKKAARAGLLLFLVSWFLALRPAEACGNADGPSGTLPAFRQASAAMDTIQAEVDSPDFVRDREALALLLAEYSEKTHGWAPPAEPLWGVLSVNVAKGYPVGRRLWLESEQVMRWRELLLAQGVQQPAMIVSRPEILVMFSEEDHFLIRPARIAGTGEPKIVLLFGRKFYRARHVQGVLPGRIETDILASLRTGDETRNPRALAELLQRLIWMAGEMSHLNSLLDKSNLEKILACIDRPENDTIRCAEAIWNYELAAAETMLLASRELKFCPRVDGCEKEADLKRITPPLVMVQFFSPSLDARSSLRNYLQFILPRMYRQQAAHFKKYWAVQR